MGLLDWFRENRELRKLKKLQENLLEEQRYLIRSFNNSESFYPGPYSDFVPVVNDDLGYFSTPRPIATHNSRHKGDSRPYLQSMSQLRFYVGLCRVLLDVDYSAIGFMDRLTDFIVGRGHAWEVSLKGDSRRDSLDHPVVKKIERALDDFREQNDWGCGAEDREVESYVRLERDGEFFLRFFRGDSDNNFVPRLRYVEPENIDYPEGGEQNGWSWGIQHYVGDVESRLNYGVYDAETGKSEIVPASRIVHCKHNTDRIVKRGISSFIVVRQPLEKIRKLHTNMMHVAAVQAAIAYVKQSPEGTTSSQIASVIKGNEDYRRKTYGTENDRDISVTNLNPGSVLNMSYGTQFNPGPASTSSSQFVQAAQSVLRVLGTRWGFPEFFSGDASNNNYASILVSGGPFERAAERRQNRYAYMQRKIAMRALELMQEAGRLTREEIDAIEIKVIPPKVAITNEQEQDSILSNRLANNVIDIQTYRETVNLDHVLIEKRLEEQRKKEAEQQQAPDDIAPLDQATIDDNAIDFSSEMLKKQSAIIETLIEQHNQLSNKLLLLVEKANLVKKTITNKAGKKQTVYVDPNKEQSKKKLSKAQQKRQERQKKNKSKPDDKTIKEFAAAVDKLEVAATPEEISAAVEAVNTTFSAMSVALADASEFTMNYLMPAMETIVALADSVQGADSIESFLFNFVTHGSITPDASASGGGLVNTGTALMLQSINKLANMTIDHGVTGAVNNALNSVIENASQLSQAAQSHIMNMANSLSKNAEAVKDLIFDASKLPSKLADSAAEIISGSMTKFASVFSGRLAFS